MTSTPHPDRDERSLFCAVITVSDTRTVADDRSGQKIQQLLNAAGHAIAAYALVRDDPEELQAQLEGLTQQPNLDAIVLNGGTGIAPRDTTYDAIERLLEKTLPGFGELFRSLSYQEIGSRAIASRAVAGTWRGKLIFSIPGSTGAVTLAMESLILPELNHLVSQLRG